MKKLPVNLNKKRWAMYAAAGAAAAFSGAATAEAQDIIHVVLGDGEGDVGAPGSLSFDLGDSGATLNFGNNAGYYGGFLAGAGVDNADASNGGVAAFFATPPGGAFNFVYGANLASGANLSTQFFQVQDSLYLIYGSAPGPNTAFTAGEGGFVGFTFDGADGGAEFGWARVTFDPAPADNSFVVEEFAFSVDGASIAVGQTEFVGVPEPTSLGLLALGAVGVLTNRRRKSIA